MRALVTGGAGFIGSHLVEALLARGDEVEVIDDLSTGREENLAAVREHPGLDFRRDTIMHEDVLDGAVARCDMVFHLAAAVGVKLIVEKPVETIETNIHGTEIVLRCAARHGRKVLIASSSEVYGKNGNAPFQEDGDCVLGPTTKSRWSYAASKAVDEYLALSYHRQKGLPAIICRFFNTVGPRQVGQYGMVLPRFVEQALRNPPITVYGTGEQTRSFAWVGDVVRAVLALADEPRAVGRVFNVGNPEEISIQALAEKVRDMVDPDAEIVHVPYEEAYEDGFEDLERRVPDVSRLRDLVGFEPTRSIDEIIPMVVDDLR
jgi:nucleoside-diphosphate-sugar epimerase